MKSNLIAAVAGGLVIGAAAFVPMGGVASPIPAAGNTVTDEKKSEDSEPLIEEPTETDEATGTAGAAGTTGKSGGYSFNKDDDDDDDDDDDEDEDDEDEEDEDDD